eukprot:c1386_g1_i1 orf=213-401(-)
MVLSYLDDAVIFLPNLELLALVLFWFFHLKSTHHTPTNFSSCGNPKTYPHHDVDAIKPLPYS